jgi:Fe2+ or Zn2+ uptake regulation protein
MNPTKDKSPLKSFLRKNGYKATPSRLAVLSLFEKRKVPLSPQALIDGLGARTDQATVYRILKTFKKRGLIRQIDFRHNHPHYELRDTNDHHHIICLSCGISEEIRGCEVGDMRQSILRQAKRFKTISDHSLEFYGLCNACLKKEVK